MLTESSEPFFNPKQGQRGPLAFFALHLDFRHLQGPHHRSEPLWMFSACWPALVLPFAGRQGLLDRDLGILSASFSVL